MTPGQTLSAASRIARELDRLSADLELLGAKLCADVDMLARNIETLQGIDLIAQQQRCLAALLRAEIFEDAIAQCPVGILTEHLRAA